MLRVLLPASLALVFSVCAAAQEDPTDTSVTRSYTPDEFARYAPRTALDMVEQIPGFSLSNDDDGSRGFGQASGNVLINGQRISGKSNGARDALARITAENVEKIEIVDGASLDIPGLSGQVANVIAEASEGISGTWEWEGRIRETVRPFLNKAEVSASGKSGNMAWTLGVEHGSGRGGAKGIERVYDGNDILQETRAEKFNFIGSRPSVSGSLAWTPDNGNIANLNASYVLWQPNRKEVSIRTPLDGTAQINRVFRGAEDEWNTEIGGDYEFGAGPGRLKLIGLYRFEHSAFNNNLIAVTIDGSNSPGLDGTSATEGIFNQTVDEGESILRGEYSWAPRDGRDWQISVEGALNTLESDADFFEAFDLAPLGPDEITDPTAKVEELRGEFLVTHGRKLTDKWTMQISAGAEVSEITQSGGELESGIETAQTFTNPKGFISSSYTVRDGYTLNARLERKVGQLNFFDFIASSDINDDIDRDANPDLSPQQSWLLELEAERDFGDWGAGSVKLFAEEIEDVVDRIPLRNDMGDIVGDAVGNIDSASILGIEFSSTLKLDPMGWKGVQLEASGSYQDSAVTDPLTGQERRLNDGDIFDWELELRHDIPDTNWAWGIYSEDRREGANFFLSEFSKRKESPPFTVVFLEHKDLFGMTGFVEIGNVLDRGDTQRRVIFDSDRTGQVDSREFLEREFGDIMTFGLSGSF